MYRIIGIKENGQIKLIKKEALNTAYSCSGSYYTGGVIHIVQLLVLHFYQTLHMFLRDGTVRWHQ